MNAEESVRRATLDVDSPNRPQPHRTPGQPNEIHAVIGRIPVAHSFRPPRGAARARFDLVSDWFWFVLTGLIFVGIPVVGLLTMLVG